MQKPLKWDMEADRVGSGFPGGVFDVVERDVVWCGPKVKFRLINPHPANLLSDHSRLLSHSTGELDLVSSR